MVPDMDDIDYGAELHIVLMEIVDLRKKAVEDALEELAKAEQELHDFRVENNIIDSKEI